MANVIADNFHQLTTRISNGPIGPFCRWWFGELKEFLPKSWRQHLQHAMRRIVIRSESDHLKMGVEENHSIQWIESLPLSQEAELQKQQVLGLIEANDLKVAPRFLLLDELSVLRKELKLPAAAESNLSQVLTFEMDRQTPFRASEVYYTWKVLSSEKESGQIRVELFVVPRKPVDAQLEMLSQRGLAASGIDLLNETGDSEESLGVGVNLLPVGQRFRVANPRFRLNLSLAAAAVVLLVVVMPRMIVGVVQ